MIISNINHKYCLINVTSSSRVGDRGKRRRGRGGEDAWERAGVRVDSPRRLGR